MAGQQRCSKCEALILDENATFCRKCCAVIRGAKAKSRWMIPE